MGLHLVLVFAIVAACVMLLGEACEIFARIALQALITIKREESGNTYWILDPQHQWIYGVMDFVEWWRLRVNSGCWIVILLGIGWFVRSWDQASRMICRLMEQPWEAQGSLPHTLGHDTV